MGIRGARGGIIKWETLDPFPVTSDSLGER